MRDGEREMRLQMVIETAQRNVMREKVFHSTACALFGEIAIAIFTFCFFFFFYFFSGIFFNCHIIPFMLNVGCVLCTRLVESKMLSTRAREMYQRIEHGKGECDDVAVVFAFQFQS